MIVPVDLAHRPAERGPFFGEWGESDDLGYRGDSLDAVVVDYGNKVREPMVGGEEGGLPCRAFVTFAIAQQAEHAMGRRPELAGIGHSRGDRKTVTQGTSGHIDAGQLVGDVTAQIGTILVVRQELFDREEAPLGEGGIEARSSVAFAQHETVPGGRFWSGGVDA